MLLGAVARCNHTGLPRGQLARMPHEELRRSLLAVVPFDEVIVGAHSILGIVPGMCELAAAVLSD